MLAFTLTLYGGLTHMVFLLRFLLGGVVDMNSIVSLKQLILSALLYAGAALSKYSLLQDLQDISDIPPLTFYRICLVIVGG